MNLDDSDLDRFSFVSLRFIRGSTQLFQLSRNDAVGKSTEEKVGACLHAMNAGEKQNRLVCF